MARSAYTIPNLLTYGRILAVPAIVLCLLIDTHMTHWIALGIFISAAITDFFDGYLARIWDQQSALGTMLDPIADKLLVACVLFMLAGIGDLYNDHLIAGIIILSREIFVSGLREFLASDNINIPVTFLAKWKTTIQMTALGFLIAGEAGDQILPITTEIGLTLLWIAALLTLYTGYDYLRGGLLHIIKQETPDK